MKYPTEQINWEELTKEQQDHFSNGCGPSFLPDVFPDSFMKEACSRHDFNYFLGGTKLDFIRAEEQFKRDGKEALEKTKAGFVKKIFMYLLLITYTAWTRVYGYYGPSWNKRPRKLKRREVTLYLKEQNLGE